MIPEFFQKEYGDRILKNINAFIESANLQDSESAKKRKRDDPDSDENEE